MNRALEKNKLVRTLAYSWGLRALNKTSRRTFEGCIEDVLWYLQKYPKAFRDVQKIRKLVGLARFRFREPLREALDLIKREGIYHMLAGADMPSIGYLEGQLRYLEEMENAPKKNR